MYSRARHLVLFLQGFPRTLLTNIQYYTSNDVFQEFLKFRILQIAKFSFQNSIGCFIIKYQENETNLIFIYSKDYWIVAINILWILDMNKKVFITEQLYKFYFGAH